VPAWAPVRGVRTGQARWAQSVRNFPVLRTPASHPNSTCNRYNQFEPRHDDSSIHPTLLRSPPTTPVRAVGRTTRPYANRLMILGSGPMSRSSGPTESGPGRPPPGEARRAANGAQAVSTLWRGGCQCQFPHVSSPTGSQAVSAQTRVAPCESAQDQYPGWLTGRQSPCQRCPLARPLGPSLPRKSESDPDDVRVVSGPAPLDIRVTSCRPAWARRNSADKSRSRPATDSQLREDSSGRR
jgi:hypothetical protein